MTTRNRKLKKNKSKPCRRCQRIFSPHRFDQLFCSRTCQSRFYNGDNPRRISRFPNAIATATAGAIGELEVATDLLRKGFEVFRSLSPACSCDLAILKDHRLLKIEVTTGYLNKNGSLSHPKKDASKFDVLAICSAEGITYKPEL